MKLTRLVTAALLLASAIAIWRFAIRALEFNSELQLAEPALARTPPAVIDPHTPRLARRVFLILVDGLRLDVARRLPNLARLRDRGVDGAATSHYPTASRPNYTTIVTGAPPIASGIRANRVPFAIRLDSIMERAKAAGLRVDTASDIGGIPSLFVRPADIAPTTQAGPGDTQLPPDGHRWPFDEVRHGDNTAELRPLVLAVARGPADLVLVVAGDVDRAGHARGGSSDAYGNAALEVDRVIGALAESIDLSRDAIMVTADHGHTDHGGHGGDEPEVAMVPLVIAGAGVVPHAQLAGAQLIDVSPTVAALLGIPAPGHGHGRALVEVLALSREQAIARTAADIARMSAVADAPVDHDPSPVIPLIILAVCLGLAIALAVQLQRAGAIELGYRMPGALAFVLTLVALFGICRGQLSPSYVPALERLAKLAGLIAIVAIGAQLAWSLRGLRGRPDRLARANGTALVGLIACVTPALVLRAIYPAPHIAVPGPTWFVAIPGIELAAAVGGLAIAFHLLIELVVSVRSTRSP